MSAPPTDTKVPWPTPRLERIGMSIDLKQFEVGQRRDREFEAQIEARRIAVFAREMNRDIEAMKLQLLAIAKDITEKTLRE
jgi:hypothetical protein